MLYKTVLLCSSILALKAKAHNKVLQPAQFVRWTVCKSRGIIVKFVMIYGPSGIGKESVGRELAKRNGWHIFLQHLAFDISCAVVGFGNNEFEKYQRNICLDAFRALIEKNVSGIVFTFCIAH